jgi:hypothetical protein
MHRVAILSALVALGSLQMATPAPVNAATPAVPVVTGNMNCTSYITGPEKIVGNVKVPDGASCTLGYLPDPSTLCCNPPPPPGFGAVWVTGNVTVGKGSKLTVGLNSIITGNIHADHCGFVEFVSEGNETVMGNVQITHCDGSVPGDPAFLSTGSGSLIHGDFHCNDNTGPCIVEGAIVGGNAEIKNDLSPDALWPSMIYDNHIGKGLKCEKIVPQPLGGGNVVGEKKEGQCAGF